MIWQYGHNMKLIYSYTNDQRKQSPSYICTDRQWFWSHPLHAAIYIYKLLTYGMATCLRFDSISIIQTRLTKAFSLPLTSSMPELFLSWAMKVILALWLTRASSRVRVCMVPSEWITKPSSGSTAHPSTSHLTLILGLLTSHTNCTFSCSMILMSVRGLRISTGVSTQNNKLGKALFVIVAKELKGF